LTFQFGATTRVPGAGTLQLQGPGTTLAGFRVFRAGSITAASVAVDVPDGTRSYNLDIRVNGVSAATLALPSGSISESTTTLAAAVNVGDIVTAFLVRTTGTGLSTFQESHAVVEVTV
jgi:hypothetical protein